MPERVYFYKLKFAFYSRGESSNNRPSLAHIVKHWRLKSSDFYEIWIASRVRKIIVDSGYSKDANVDNFYHFLKQNVWNFKQVCEKSLKLIWKFHK